ncbi:MAG TPA: hypothetical protein VGF37_09035 [Chthoniobacterales bacterium]|jgi:hypothetical protein
MALVCGAEDDRQPRSPDKLVLPVALARFREQRPLVEATALDMNNRAQVEAVAREKYL